MMFGLVPTCPCSPFFSMYCIPPKAMLHFLVCSVEMYLVLGVLFAVAGRDYSRLTKLYTDASRKRSSRLFGPREPWWSVKECDRLQPCEGTNREKGDNYVMSYIP